MHSGVEVMFPVLFCLWCSLSLYLRSVFPYGSFSLPSRSLTRYCPLCEVSVLRGGDKTTRVLLEGGLSL